MTAVDLLLRYPANEPLAALVSGGGSAAHNSWTILARPSEALVFPAFFGTGGGNNFGKYSNPEVDRLVTAAGEAPDIAARSRLYQQAQKLITEDSAHVWLTVPSEIKAYTRRVRGFVNFGDWRLRAETITLGS